LPERNRRLVRILSAAVLMTLAVAPGAWSQSIDSTIEATADPNDTLADPRWDGQWLAEGTLFQISVNVADGMLMVEAVESLGFTWTSEPGEVNGSVARIPVSYAGVNGIVQAELVDATTAVAFAASCLPEFMVVCTLARNQQAVFRKVAGPGDRGLDDQDLNEQDLNEQDLNDQDLNDQNLDLGNAAHYLVDDTVLDGFFH